ncbi:hypothetical protein [Hyphomicrobium sp.]|uniref:hypothetical protein n=1 Tax=Hyphomicrobium sp. TaxID=82 RepID=UPI0025C024E7|nr:hypothetical protein [Hyphomicrobium sp.]MCC7252938.1 hypothetical protein [Hyphomicrobium sp.]
MRALYLWAGALVAVACSSGPFRQPPPPAGAASRRIGSRGGTVAVRDRSSPLYGVTVHIPPGALRSETQIEIRPSTLPHDSNALLAGPAFELLPRGTTFAQPITVVLPVYDGITDLTDVTAGYLDEDSQPIRWVRLVTAAQVGFADPVAQVGMEVTLSVDHFTHFAPMYAFFVPITVESDISPEFQAEILGVRPLSELTHGYSFVTPLEGLMGLTHSLADPLPAMFEVVDGSYMVRIRSGNDERCVAVTTPGPSPFVRATATSPRCNERPTATLQASTTLIRRDGRVELTGGATSASGGQLTYYWNATGGVLNDREGVMASGQSVTSSWRPTRTGTFDIYFTAYDENGLFGEGRVTIVVRGNDRPEIVSFLATPIRIGQGAPEGARTSVRPLSMGDAEAGLTLLSVIATDPDDDVLSYFWWHGLPGNYFNPLTGDVLGRDPMTGLATDTVTGMPYTADTVLYMAPPESWLCEGLPLGMWLGLHVTASDGYAVDRSWVMVGMECIVGPPPGANDGSHCYRPAPAWENMDSNGAFCYGVPGPFADWISVECNVGTSRAGGGPCPGGPTAGACVDTNAPEGSIGTDVYYGLDATQAEAARVARCTGADEVWIYPYMP